MNNEFNNNFPDEQNTPNDFTVVNNTESVNGESSDQRIDYIHNSNDYYTYPSGNTVDVQSVEVTSEQPSKSKKAKRRKSGKARKTFTLVAAGMAFGLFAGVAFQGYFYVMNATGHGLNTNNQNIPIVQDVGTKDTVVPSNTSTGGEVVTDVSDVVAKVMPSIVAINSSANQTGYDFFGREVTQPVEGSGSGIIIGQNGSQLLIVTNNHVIDGATNVQIVFSDKKTATATIKGADANADLAILTVNTKDLSADTLKAIKVAVLGKSDQVEAGDMAIAIGNALGYGQSVTVGYISAVEREVDIDNKKMKLLQTDAAINPGNSGGALLNTKGEVIGINSVKYASEEVEGMGYAIPISSALPLMNELINRETVTESEKGYLGIEADTAQNVTEEYSKRFNMPIGVYVNNVLQGSPAEKAGLKQGDIITGIDNAAIKTIDDLANAISYKKAGQDIQLKVQEKSDGAYKEKVLKITLAKKN